MYDAVASRSGAQYVNHMAVGFPWIPKRGSMSEDSGARRTS
jgi:hypothetical protein